MSAADPMVVGTLAGALRNAAARLRVAEIPDPQREAADIWSGLHDISPGDSWLRRSEPVSESDLAVFHAAVDHRARGIPTAYVVGRAAFRHVVLNVDQRVLIPRPETEGLVDRVLAEAAAHSGADVLEIGVGSGAIIVSLALEGRFGRLVGTDVSSGALQVARANAHAVAPEIPIEWRSGDLFEPVVGEEFDIIVANPPYLARNEYQLLDPSVRCHEPRVALESGEDGMTHIASICEESVQHLRQGGLLLLEIDARRGDKAAAAARAAGLVDVLVERDLFGRDRYLLARPR